MIYFRISAFESGLDLNFDSVTSGFLRLHAKNRAMNHGKLVASQLMALMP